MKTDTRALVDRLASELRTSAEALVPWFLEQMPAPYFQDTDEASRAAHLRALLAARASGSPVRLRLQSEDGSVWTLIHEDDRPGLLAQLLQQLPADRPLRSAKVHTSADGRLILDVFTFGETARCDPGEPSLAVARAELLEQARARGNDEPEELDEFLRGCPVDYVRAATPARLLDRRDALGALRGSDDTHVTLADEPEQVRLTVLSGNAPARELFERIGTYLGQRRLDIRRAYLDAMRGAAGQPVTVLTFVLSPDPVFEDSEARATLVADLRRLEWVPASALELYYESGFESGLGGSSGASREQSALGLRQAETLDALSSLVHAKLSSEDAHRFSRGRLRMLVARNLGVARRVAQAFLDRFAVPDAPDELDALRTVIEAEVGHEDARRVLGLMLDATAAAYRSNAHLDSRFAFAIRLDPQLLLRPDQEVPFGVFHVHGRGFDGFHVRFADIARGGVRAVRPRDAEQHALESERLFEEAYGLAFAQQLKNKDIPEGGSKAVILVTPGHRVESCVRAFADALLDLTAPDVSDRVHDRWGAPEHLYLGPDENISPADIEWIVDRAGQRGLRFATAFMSSKPGAGINHKEYGVTSEGVTVFLEEALRAVGIDPRRQPFTVTLTGGPDGDVAGNEIAILHREFGAHVRIVGIADGSGVAEDPDGLPIEDLLALVERSEPIVRLRPHSLGPRGRLLSIETAEGMRARNTMHLRSSADAFVPAGGRPQTIHERNWSRFLDEQGVPRSRVIVEGANLFITEPARQRLSEAGVLVVKDSSANKCGVICSSFEIIASMLLSPAEFLEIKARFVDEVLERLRELARQEARLLFRIHARHPDVPLSTLSVRLSRAILAASDAIEADLPSLEGEDAVLAAELVRRHIPPVLRERAADRIETRLPLAYRNRIIASSLATRIIYREGPSILEAATPKLRARRARRYLRAEHSTERLIDALAASDVPERDRIASLLRLGGARAALELGLDRE